MRNLVDELQDHIHSSVGPHQELAWAFSCEVNWIDSDSDRYSVAQAVSPATAGLVWRMN